jgi:hypothetical protein
MIGFFTRGNEGGRPSARPIQAAERSNRERDFVAEHLGNRLHVHAPFQQHQVESMEHGVNPMLR